jgi:glycosyltransferase involved in cell wall biosynthesis
LEAEKLRISVVSTTTYSTPPVSYGGEVFFWDLAEALAQMGNEVHLFGAPGSRCPTNGFLHYIRGTYGSISLAVENEVYQMYKDDLLKSDFIIDCSHDHLVAEQIYWFHREHAKKLVNVLNGVVTIWPRCRPWNMIVGSNKWKELVVNAVSQFKGTPWENSNFDIPLPKRFEENEVHVIPWACDTSFYTPSKDYSKGDYFLWVGRPTPYKGLGKAIELVMKADVPFKVLASREILEHQYYGVKFSEMIEKANTKGAKIEMVEGAKHPFYHMSKVDLYRNAKALIFPSESHEPFGLVLIEAMACGCPAIVSNLGALPEIIENGVNGFVCASDQEYLEAIKNIDAISSETCRKVAIEKFDRIIAAQNYLALYQQLKDREVA